MSAFAYEQLGSGIEVCVSPVHTFGTDAFLLSSFSAPKKHETACDLGSGCGIIPLAWMRTPAPKKAYAVDIQPLAVEQMQRSLQRSALQGRFVPILADLRALRGVLPFGEFDLLTCNPPYNAAQSGISSQSDADRISRHETLCTLDDVCLAAKQLLRFGGRLCICQLPERLVDLLSSMRAHGVEPKRLRFVQQQANSVPWLVLVEGKRGAKPFLSLDPPLLLKDQHGNDSPELAQIYGAYRSSPAPHPPPNKE